MPLSSKKSKSPQTKIRNSEYRRKMRDLEKAGLYSPTDKTLTEWRKRQINSLYREYGDRLEKNAVLGAKVPRDKKLNAQLKELGFNVKSGRVIVERRGFSKAKIQFNKKTGEYEIKVTGKKQVGKTIIKRTSQVIPLPGPDSIANQRKRFRKQAKSLGPLGKHDTIIFRVVGPESDGLSHSSFSDVDKLINYLDNEYTKTTVDRYAFYRMIELEKTTRKAFVAERKSRMKSQKRKVNKTGRSI